MLGINSTTGYIVSRSSWGAFDGFRFHEIGDRYLNVCSIRGEVPEVQDPCLCDSFCSFPVASLGYHCQARPLRIILGHLVGRIDYPLFLLYNCVTSVMYVTWCQAKTSSHVVNYW